MQAFLARIPWFWVLIGWTVFLWLSRLRNVLNNDDLSSTGVAVRVGEVVVFLVLAAVAVMGRRRQQQAPQIVFVVWTIGYWLVQGTGILIDGQRSIGFKAVHTVLMVVSVVLSVLAARQMRPAR